MSSSRSQNDTKEGRDNKPLTTVGDHGLQTLYVMEGNRIAAQLSPSFGFLVSSFANPSHLPQSSIRGATDEIRNFLLSDVLAASIARDKEYDFSFNVSFVCPLAITKAKSRTRKKWTRNTRGDKEGHESEQTKKERKEIHASH